MRMKSKMIYDKTNGAGMRIQVEEIYCADGSVYGYQMYVDGEAGFHCSEKDRMMKYARSCSGEKLD